MIKPFTVKAIPNAIEPHFSLFGPIFPFDGSLNRQITTEALNTDNSVSSADARTEELFVVAEAKNEAAQKITEATRLASVTARVAFLHFNLSFISKTVSCFFALLPTSSVNDMQGDFSKTLSFVAGLNSALKWAANLGEHGGEVPSSWCRPGPSSWTLQTVFDEGSGTVLPFSVSCFFIADCTSCQLLSSNLLKIVYL